MTKQAEGTTGQRRMRATLVRFGPDLFEDLKVEAERSGISVAQFVREAVVARIAYNAGRRGEPVGAPPEVRARARATKEESVALRAESRQATRHARESRAARKAAR